MEILDAPLAPISRRGPRPLGPGGRPRVEGKFLFVGDERLEVHGVAYVPVAEPPNEYGRPEDVARDFARIAAAGFDAIRTYTAPPGWMLDEAAQRGLWVIAGHAWEQHVALLENPRLAREVEGRIGRETLACSGHPAVLCHVVANEVPASIVRWQGARRTERFLARLAATVREADPGALVTFANYPTTEYLETAWADLSCCNVFLESVDRFEAYVARLQTLAGDRPLLLGEIGLDSSGRGEVRQAGLLAEQVRAARRGGCAGTVVFAWTDAWHRGGSDVEGWAFGLTRRDRSAKPALAAVSRAVAESPAGPTPRVSVVVCTHDGARTVRECLEALARLDYPDVEVLVVDDGSTDGTGEIASEYDVRVIRTEHCGLANARNTGLREATGEIVAYLDDDAYPDALWLRHLVPTLASGEHVGVGGPNIPPGGDGVVADAVACAPGGPVHVLLSDREAEHIPGCNMALRRDALIAVGGFDPRFRAAGDDVDVCWRLQEQGGKLGFSPGAVVWHHRRSTVSAYLRQQRGYGKAEALLERKWPAKYNAAGHHPWTGQVYGGGLSRMMAARWRVYHGIWGAAPFQGREPLPPRTLSALPRMPEWYLALAGLASLVAVAGSAGEWAAFATLGGVLAAASAWTLAAAWRAAGRAVVGRPAGSDGGRRSRRLVWVLHLAQPVARLSGRLGHGLTPWRRSTSGRPGFPRTRRASLWAERRRAPEAWVEAVESAARDGGAPVVRGGPYASWDLEVRAGALAGARVAAAVEEHDGGRQLVRFRWWPRVAPGATLAASGGVAFAASTAAAGAPVVGVTVGVATLALWLAALRQAAVAVGAAARAVERGR